MGVLRMVGLSRQPWQKTQHAPSDEGLSKTSVALARRGDTTALRLCFYRIAPVRRGGHIEILDFPKVESSTDVPKAHATILSAVTAGHVTADEVKLLSGLLAAHNSAFDIIDTAAEVAEIKRMHKKAYGVDAAQGYASGPSRVRKRAPQVELNSWE